MNAPLREGLHLDVDDAAYFADPCERPSLTSSLFRTMVEKSGAHAMALLNVPRDASRAMR